MQPPSHTHATQWSTPTGVSQGDSERGLSHNMPPPHLVIISQALPQLYPIHISAHQEVKGSKFMGVFDGQPVVTRTTRSRSPRRGLAGCFPCSGGAAMPPSPAYGPREGQVSSSRSHSSSVEGRVQGRHPQGGVLPSRLHPLRQQRQRTRSDAVS